MNFYPIEIKFRNASGKWGSLAEQAIKVVSPKRIHVEGKFPDGRSFSSSSAKDAIDGGNGVRWKDIGYTHPERWTTYVLWVTEEELDSIIFDCNILTEMGLRYDYRGAAGCLWSGVHNFWKWFCSEVVYEAICTKWLPSVMNYKMHPDKLEMVVIVLAAKLLERKNRVDGH